MLERLEMHDIQDKTRLLDEMNETRDGVNKVRAEIAGLTRKVHDLMKAPVKSRSNTTKSKVHKPNPGPVKSL